MGPALLESKKEVEVNWLKRLFHKPRPLYEVHITKRPDGRWQAANDFTGESAEGVDALAALMLHVQFVSEATGVDGRAILDDMVRMADSGGMSFYPAFEGLA